MDLLSIYLAALARCDPASLVEDRLGSRPELRSRPVVAIGKCATRMAQGLARGGWRGRGVAIVPSGYESSEPIDRFEIVLGSHPYIDDASFRAGDALLRFVDALRAPALVLLSGGASAAVEAPLDPHVSRTAVTAINERLVRSGLPIAQINVARKHLSAIKGGRLALRLHAGSESWILSDVPPGRPELVGSGPTSADPSTSEEAASVITSLGGDEAFRIADALRDGTIPETPKRIESHATGVLADNRAFIAAAAQVAVESEGRSRGSVTTVDGQLDGEVERVASILAGVAGNLDAGAIAIGGGEPTVAVSGDGRGGRCSELALRLLRLAAGGRLPPFAALIGSSDGRDGNSGAAGYVVDWDGNERATGAEIDDALAASDAHALASRIGTAIVLPPTGNNLRDIMIMARR